MRALWLMIIVVAACHDSRSEGEPSCDDDGTCVCDPGFGGDDCTPCAAGSYGVDCASSCSGGACVGAVTCDPIDGSDVRCAACAVGSTGPACEDTCAVGHCIGIVTCAQDGSARACGSCEAGYYGSGCESECVLPGGCAAGASVTCDAEGVATSCSSCAAGFHGAACAETCAVGHCVGAVTCAADGSARVCESCATGYFGSDCESACAVPSGCAAGASVACNAEGEATSCSACIAGRRGPTCAEACPQGFHGAGCTEGCVVPSDCAPTATVECDGATGEVSACSACDPGRYGPTCGETCASGHCVGAVTCAQDGSARVCAGCATGYYGSDCESTCAVPSGCAAGASVTCDASGDATSCSACVAGRYGPTCADTCAAGFYGPGCTSACVVPNDCVADATLTCNPVDGTVTSCSACDPGRYGTTCANACASGHCVGAVTCAQDGSARVCAGCATGYYGSDCESTCAVPSGCAAGASVTCDASGDATSCSACVAGRYGPTCADTCAAGFYGPGCVSACVVPNDCVADATLTCNPVDGTVTRCSSCDPGSYGPTCASACDAGNCLGAITCTQDNGTLTTCASCATGTWGATCTEACPVGHCVGAITCNMATGAPIACDACVAPWSGPTCADYPVRATCLAWKEQGETADGLYWIDPDGEAGPAIASRVYCDMSNGGFTFFKVSELEAIDAADAEAVCAERGMQLFIPRTPAHLARAYAIALDETIGPDGSAEYLRIMGIYPNVAGATCASTPLQSDNPSCQWDASDGGSFWVSNRTNVAQPSGDNTLGESMAYTFDGRGNASAWDDTVPGATSTRFFCDTGDVGVASPRVGDDASNPAESCLMLFRMGRTSGPYYITTDLGARYLYCDMTPSDGGWTLVGEANLRADVYDTWLRSDRSVADLATANNEGGVMACASVIDLAVNKATEVRLSNQTLTRWVRWPMAAGRNVSTWWKHSVGQATIDAAPDLSVTVTGWSGQATCYQNVYGVMPLNVHGGSYPFASINTAGNTNVSDLCMGIGVQITSTTADGFTQNGNGYDAAQNDSDWPNSSYQFVTPFVSVWLR